MPPEDLPPKVKDLLANRLDKTVFVRADARAQYEKVVDVVDNLRAAGVDQLGLLTEQIQEQGKKPQGGRRRRRPGSSRDQRFIKGAISMAMAVGGSRAVRNPIST